MTRNSVCIYQKTFRDFSILVFYGDTIIIKFGKCLNVGMISLTSLSELTKLKKNNKMIPLGDGYISLWQVLWSQSNCRKLPNSSKEAISEHVLSWHDIHYAKSLNYITQEKSSNDTANKKFLVEGVCLLNPSSDLLHLFLKHTDKPKALTNAYSMASCFSSSA